MLDSGYFNGHGRETTYGGILFRSRLEAEWAKYFDAKRLRWKYEPRTFRSRGDWGTHVYTPDFLLVGKKVYLEIKPESVNFSNRLGLAESEDYLIFLVVGSPLKFGVRLVCRAGGTYDLATQHLSWDAWDCFVGLPARQALWVPADVGYSGRVCKEITYGRV